MKTESSDTTQNTLPGMEETVDPVDSTVDNGASSSSQPRSVLDDNGLHFMDPKITSPYWDKNQRRKNFKSIEWLSISPSFIENVLTCPAKAVAEKYIMKDLQPIDPLGANQLGSAFHKVMEIFFTLPPERRNNKNVRTAFKKALMEEDFDAIRNDAPSRDHVKNWISKLWMSGFDWQTIRPKMIDDGKGPKPALEYFVKGNLGKADRPALGFIDMLAVDENDDSKVRILDWKTGKSAHIYDPNDRFPDFNYTRQQIIYTMLLENKGYNVSSAQLVYPAIDAKDDDGNVVFDENGNKKTETFIQDLPIHDEKLRSRAIDEIETVSAVIDDSVKANTWEYNPGGLCSWCPLVNICPAARKSKKANAVKSRQEQPTAEDLAGQIELESSTLKY